jgi:hypothetical protein
VVPLWIEGNPRRREIWDNLSGTWNETGDHLWTKGTNKGYGKTWYLNVGGWAIHFLFWAWREVWLYEQGVAGGDIDRFCAEHPEIPAFVWPDSTDELVLLRAIKQWMAEPFGAAKTSFGKTDPRYGVYLSIDHCCPGFPNPLCGNWRHHRLETGSDNSKLRHERRRGDGRLKAEARSDG